MTRTLADEIAGLKDLDMVTLAARHFEVFGRATRSKNREQLWRRVAWGMQARAHGGLSDVAKARLAELQSTIELPVEVRAVLPAKKKLDTGRVLKREWRNQQIEVVVTATGFEWNGVPFKSLSAVAKAITGAAWNGYVFFGLTERKRK
jgi:hypothetical protein